MGLVLHRLLVGASRAATRRSLLTPLVSFLLLFCFSHPYLPLPPLRDLHRTAGIPGCPAGRPAKKPCQRNCGLTFAFFSASLGLVGRQASVERGVFCVPLASLAVPWVCAPRRPLLLEKVRLLVTRWPASLGLLPARHTSYLLSAAWVDRPLPPLEPSPRGQARVGVCGIERTCNTFIGQYRFF